jgi:hypothetical protein
VAARRRSRISRDNMDVSGAVLMKLQVSRGRERPPASPAPVSPAARFLSTMPEKTRR